MAQNNLGENFVKQEEDGIKRYRVLISAPQYVYVDARSLQHAKDRVMAQVNTLNNTVNLPITVVGVEWVGDNQVLPELIGSPFKLGRKV